MFQTKTFLFPLMILLLCACAHELSREQRAAYQSAMAHPLEFSLKAEQAGEAWARARWFVQRFSPSPIRRETEEVLETAPAHPGEGGEFVYKVERSPAGEFVRFRVSCTIAELASQSLAQENARLLAYYIATGSPMDDFVNRRAY